MNTSAWRWFPLGLGVAMAMTFAVNGYMIYDALHTFPGAAGQDGFDLSNGYGRIVAAENRQSELGWQVDARVTAERYPALTLTDRAGAPLKGVTIEAQAERPVGPKDTVALIFRPIGNGRYQADTSLFSGQWDVMLTVRADGQVFTTTRRVVVR